MAKFSNKSKEKLKGVHPDLVKVLELAITDTKQDFSITEGVRTKEQQAIYVRTGKSKTMNSKHLIQSDGYGHAVDVVPNPVSWELDKFYLIADAIEKAAEFYGVNIRWGGAWIKFDNNQDDNERGLVEDYTKTRRLQGKKAFIDAPHFEIVL